MTSFSSGGTILGDGSVASISVSLIKCSYLNSNGVRDIRIYANFTPLENLKITPEFGECKIPLVNLNLLGGTKVIYVYKISASELPS